MKLWLREILLLLCFFNYTYPLSWHYYRISAGDSLEKIAKNFQVSVSQLQLWNSITNPNSIYVGQRLRILKEDEFVYLTPGDDEPNFSQPIQKGRLEKSYSNSLQEPYYGILWQTSQNAEVFAAEGGKVVNISPVRGYGTCIFLDHGGGWLTVYAHLGKIFVKKGEKVHKKQLLATTERNSLFFTISFAGKPINPQKWLRHL